MALLQRRTDLALEAQELRRGAALPGVTTEERRRFGCAVTEVRITERAAADALGKPPGTYVTLDLRPFSAQDAEAAERAARALGAELRALLAPARASSALVVGLGNADVTPDALGPLTAERVLVTRHLTKEPPFAGLVPVSVLTPGVLGRTGIEAAETIRGAADAVRPDALIAVDALAARSLERVCATVQLSDTGIVPGSGVGNRRAALDRETLGLPVFAVGVPTVVDAATLALDLLEAAGAAAPEPAALPGGAEIMVTPRDIDAQVRALARIVGAGVNLALQPLDYADLTALTG